MSFRKFNGITLKNNATIENLHIERLASDPSIVEAGRLWYNSTDKTVKMSVRNASDSLVVKTFVDDAAFENWKQGLIVKDAVDVVVTETNVDPALGLSLTKQDNQVITLNDRVLLNTAADARNNGIYKISAVNASDVPYATKIFATGTTKDDIVISPKTGFGIDTPINLTVTSHANGTPASIVDSGNTVQLSLEQVGQRSAKELIVSSSDLVTAFPVAIRSLIGGSFKLVAKTTSTYKHFKFQFEAGSGSRRAWACSSYVDTGNVYCIIVNIASESTNGWYKTIQEVVDYMNTQTIITDHLDVTVNVLGTKIFAFGGSIVSGYQSVYYILKREEDYTTTASEVLTLINSTERLKATVNGQTTLDPRWVSIFGTTQWSVRTGTFDNTAYTDTSGTLALMMASSSPFRQTVVAENTKNCFLPSKVRFTFTGPIFVVKIFSFYNTLGLNYDTKLYEYGGFVSGEEVTLDLSNGFRTTLDDINVSSIFSIQFIGSPGFQVSNIEFYVGDDYKIYSDKLFSEADGTQEWRQIFGLSNYIGDPNQTSWNGSAYVPNISWTGTSYTSIESYMTLNTSYNSAFKYNSTAPFNATKLKITFTPGTANITLLGSENNVISNYVSGSIIDLSPLTIANYSNGIQFSAASPITVTNIEFFDGVTGWNPVSRTSMKINSLSIERTEDANNTTINSELKSGVTVFIEKGTTYGGTQFTLTTPGDITIGATPITFSQFSSASDISVGPGLERNGNQISIIPDGDSLTVSNFGIKLTDGMIKETLMSLNDVPYYIGDPGQYLVVDANQTGFEFATPSSTVITAGNGLNKVNDEFSIKLDGTTLSVGTDGLKVSASTIRTKITELIDAPSTYGTAGQVLVVNPTADGFILATPSDATTVVNSLKDKINANIYKITTSTPNTQHTITHGLDSDYVDVTVWVYDTQLSKYVNDSVAVTLTSTNALVIDLTESANVKVIVEKKDDIVLS